MRVKGWAKFQHFKDRKPPWIKLYRDLLDDLEWFQLPPESAKLLINLWLIASENNGNLPDIKVISFRCHTDIKVISKILPTLSHWLEESEANSSMYQDDITVISDRYQDDTLERETEREKETETEKERESTRKKYGEFQNVLLTDEQTQKLIDRFGNDDALARIERLSLYMASKRTKYSNHYATILSWANSDTNKTASNVAPMSKQQQISEFTKQAAREFAGVL